VINARQFQTHGVSGLGFKDFGMGYTLSGGHLLLKSLEEFEGRLAKSDHDCYPRVEHLRTWLFARHSNLRGLDEKEERKNRLI
jgi:hypothetical protein